MVTRTVLGYATVTRVGNVCLIKQVLPFLKVKPGDKVMYVLVDGNVTVQALQVKKR
jgi:hypothetical protein